MAVVIVVRSVAIPPVPAEAFAPPLDEPPPEELSRPVPPEELSPPEDPPPEARVSDDVEFELAVVPPVPVASLLPLVLALPPQPDAKHAATVTIPILDATCKPQLHA